MRVLILAAALGLGAMASANQSIPPVELLTGKSFKEKEATSLFFFSPSEKPIHQAGFCIGKDCEHAAETVSLRQAAQDKPNMLWCRSSKQYNLEEGTKVMLRYTVDGDSTVYERDFELKDSAHKSEGDAAKFDVTEAKVAAPGQAVAVATAPVPGVAAAAAASATGGVPAHAVNFYNWLNQARASAGLGPVAYDSNLEAWAYQNSVNYLSTGQPHAIMGPARRQNWAGHTNWESGWSNSPAHAAALFDPTITHFGLGGVNGSWTFSAN